MAKVELLDCTLRDGGYINHWNFGREIIKTVCSKLVESNIDIIEVGFLTNKSYSQDDSLFSNLNEIDEILPKQKRNSKIAAMIALGEMEINPFQLSDASHNMVDIIRITFHNQPEEQERAIAYARELMSKGYLICMQPVGTTSYSDGDLLRLINAINALHPYAFYLVDTLGVLYKQDLLRLLYLIDHNLATNIKIGFHSHNNIQMSFANAQEIIEFNSSRDFIIDSSVYGMGRGAGNLCTEIVAEYLNRITGPIYNIFPMMEIVDECLFPIYLNSSWGYSAGYYLSSTRNCHPNYATYLLSKQTLRVRDIGVILNKIPIENREIFDKKLIKKLYLSFQNNEIDDVEERKRLSKELMHKKILLLAPGKSIQTHNKLINDFICEENPYVVSINFAPNFPLDLIFISNRKRFATLQFDEKKVLFTSNVESRPSNSRVVNYSSLLNSNDYVYDNAGLLFLNLLYQCNINTVYLAGFDGFTKNLINNFYDENQNGITDPKDLLAINSGIEHQLNMLLNKIKLVFITPTNYRFN